MKAEDASRPQAGEDMMVYLPGETRSFRCDAPIGFRPCGCNVFRKLDTDASKLRCNSCKAIYSTMAQANAEVKAIKRAESNGAGNVRVLHSRYLGELRDEE